MARVGSSPSFADYRTVSEAAEYLGVSAATLRNWDRTGKLKPRRHPQNGYRIYLHQDLEALLASANRTSSETIVPAFDWRQVRETDHFVHFYEHDEYLTTLVSGFVAAALLDQQASVVIGTREHCEAINRKLSDNGVDVSAVLAEGRYVVLDAEEMLARFMVEGTPDAAKFAAQLGGVLARLQQRRRRIHAFGEMVALLWNDGNHDAAIRVEELWNELGKQYRFALFCAYRMNAFGSVHDQTALQGICNCHTRVVPSESYTTLTEEEQRLRAITLLQQKAQSLEAEIAHREHVERTLAQRERELSDFFESATEGLHKVGADGKILWANKSEYEMLGYTADEYIGHPIAHFHADADVIAVILDKLRHGEVLENYPARLRCRDGSIRHVLINSNACFENGQFAYTRCFTRDVTPRWMLESSLREADQRKDEFLAILAHELRNPLAPASNALATLRHPECTDELSQEAQEILERQVRQMTRLVDDLLDLSRITRDKLELRKEYVDLASMIRNAIETSRPLIEAAGHRLTVSLPEQQILLHADAARISQVFSNLLNNSAKYTESGGHIRLTAKCQENMVVVSVRDNGIGISCDALAHVFDMFQQLDRSLERSQGGLGIGLTLVRRLVELHGGTVNARSEGPGKGSEFVVHLPMPTVNPVASQSQDANASSTNRRRVLVVDDNKDSADTMRMLLNVKGHEVRTANNGCDAIEIAATFQPEIILMDVGMPKMNGYEATRRIRQLPNGKDLFIVALTGWGQPENRRQSLEAGCSAHLVKPIDLDELDDILAREHGRT